MKLRGSKARLAEGIARNVKAIAAVERQSLSRRSLGQRLGDLIGAGAGTLTFAVIHVIWFAVWILANLGALPGVPVFDPYPFSFLTFVVSLEAIFLSVFVLVSQNRLARDADLRTHIDLQVNLLAEQEATTMLRLLTRICEHLGVPHETLAKDAALLKRTDVKEIIARLEATLPSSNDESKPGRTRQGKNNGEG